jgi:hypothetical protein
MLINIVRTLKQIKFKQCRRCKQLLPETDFIKNHLFKDGIDTICRECNKNYCRTYYKNNKKRLAEINKNYIKNHPEIRKKSLRKWNKSDNKKQCSYKYIHSDAGEKWRKNNIKKIRENAIQQYAKRKRKLGFFKLIPNTFPDEIKIHYHHINNFIVIPIPKVTHLSTLGLNHREKCNRIIEKIYGIELEKYF